MDRLIRFFVFVLFCAFVFIAGWVSAEKYSPIHKIQKQSRLDKIKHSKHLNVVLLNSSTTYYVGSNAPQGFEYELLKSYADSLDVKLNITVVNTLKEALSFYGKEQADVISASITKTKELEKRYNFGPSYFEVTEQVVCSREMILDDKFPRDVEDLESLHVEVADGTSYMQTLNDLKKDGYDINVTISDEYSTEELLARVAKHQIDCTVVNSNIYSINHRYYPEAKLAFNISATKQLAWVLPGGAKELKSSMYAWLNMFYQSGKMAELKDKYYSHVMSLDYYNTKMFYKRIKTRLPKYKDYFIEVAKIYNIPWKLLASIAYQESQWNPKARSFTGVKGMMMLTLRTAKFLGIKNRLDPYQSIKGGARHIKQMIRMVPQAVEGENRLKFALAAYNVGFGHLMDAITLAHKLHYDPYSWNGIKKTLPLLNQKRYYKKLKYGYARGEEPVIYVESIYNYKDMLEKILDEDGNIKGDI